MSPHTQHDHSSRYYYLARFMMTLLTLRLEGANNLKDANARFGRRGDELVVRVVQQVGEGEQLLVECYLEDE